jgi:hypothetical protein
MHATDAEDTIRAIERVRRDTRRALHPLWFPNVVVAVFFLGATLIAALATAYWAIGAPLGLFLIVRDAVRYERALLLLAAGLVERAWERA